MTGRWALLSALDVGDPDPYLDRLRLVQTPLFGLYLHHIHRPDREPDPHDHPWWFASLVLTGPRREDWGFWGRFVYTPHRQYQYGRTP